MPSFDQKMPFNCLPDAIVLDVLKKVNVKTAVRLMKSNKKILREMEKRQRFDIYEQYIGLYVEDMKQMKEIRRRIQFWQLEAEKLDQSLEMKVEKLERAEAWTRVLVIAGQNLKAAEDKCMDRRLRICNSSWL